MFKRHFYKTLYCQMKQLSFFLIDYLKNGFIQSFLQKSKLADKKMDLVSKMSDKKNDLISKAWDAARLDNLEILKTLVPSQVHPNSMLVTEKNQCHSLLMSASAFGSISCAEYLIEQGADPNLKNFNGFTALHWAAFTGKPDAIPILLKHNADIESRTNDGKTPLHIAAQRGQRPFISSLLTNGADIHAVDSEGWNCLHMAVLGRQNATADWLLNLQFGLSQNLDSSKLTICDIAKNEGLTWFEEMYKSKQDSK